MDKISNIKEAIRRRKVMSFTYKGGVEIFYPLGIGKETNGVVLIAVSAGTHKVYLYNLDKMTNCRRIPSSFVLDLDWCDHLPKDLEVLTSEEMRFESSPKE